MITQKELAKKVGVSQGAISAALNNNKKIRLPEKLQQRILKTAQKMDYRPCRHAQMLRGRKSGFIGILQSVGIVQTAMERALYLSKAVYESGYQALAGESSWHDEQRLQPAVDMFIDARVEGVIVLGNSPVDLKRLHRAGIPVVGFSSPAMNLTTNVISDVSGGMFDLTRHALSLGYRRIVLLSITAPKGLENTWFWSAGERIRGFKNAVSRQAKTGVETKIITTSNTSPRDWLDPYLSGKEGMEKILHSPDRPEIVLCTNDNWAIGALSACVKESVAVPRDIALTGFDNTLMGRYSTVPLTTVDQPNEEMAKLSVALLLRLIKGEKLTKKERLNRLPCRLIVRESCGAGLLKRKEVIRTEAVNGKCVILSDSRRI